MPRQPRVETHSAEELRRLQMEKRRAEREARLDGFRKGGRLTRVLSGEEGAAPLPAEEEDEALSPLREWARTRRRKGVDRFLLAVEVLAVAGLLFIIINGVNLMRSFQP